MIGWSFLLAMLSTAVARPVMVDRVAAVVNDDVITLTEVYALGGDFIDQRVEQGLPGGRRAAELEVLDSLILRRLISQEIERLDLDVTQMELDRTVDDIAGRNGLDREQLRIEVEASDMSWLQYQDELRESIRQMKFTQAIIRPRISVDEDELVDAYRRLVASANLPKVVDLGAIFIAKNPGQGPAGEEQAQARLAQVQEKLASGVPFADVAREFDEGPYGPQGGRMGSYRQGELVDFLDSVAFSLGVGETGAPVESPQGYFVLHVFELRTEAATPLEDVRDQLFEQVYADRIEEETEQWSRQARRRAAVLIKLEEAGSR